MKKTAYSLIFLIMLLVLVLVFPSCNGGDEDTTEIPTAAPTETPTEEVTEDPDTVTSENVSDEATEDVADTEEPTEEPTEESTECYHPYASSIDGHWKPACDKCGKAQGRVQSHEYEERVEDEGDLLLYVYRCSICRYRAYEQEVPYEINSFYSAGDLTVASSPEFTSKYVFEAGVGHTSFTKSAVGNGTVNIVQNGIMMLPSGKYMVAKMRLPGSASGFSLSIKSICADGALTVPFEGIESGWVTVVIDITKAISTSTSTNSGTGETVEKKLGYQADVNNLHYLFSCALIARTTGAAESFDISYVMFCDTLSDAENFVKNEKKVYTYADCMNEDPVVEIKPCVDENGAEIKHEYECDAESHSLYSSCYQCGRPEVYGEEHTFAQMRINGELTYACSVCEYLQFGTNINKYITALEINTTAPTYYKVNKTDLMSEDGVEFARFTGRGETAQVLFARNNYASSEAEEAAAFSIGTGDTFIIRMRTNAPEVVFSIYFRTEGGSEKSVQLPLTMTEAGAWGTYAIDLSAVLPLATVPDEKGEYKIISLYYTIGTYSVKSEDGKKNGADFTSEVQYDINFMAFVDDWSELQSIVTDENTIKVNASNLGAVINTARRECLGEHIWGEEANGNVYTYLCANCRTPLKVVEVPESVKRYFTGYEIARNAVVYAASGTKSVGLDDDLTIFGTVRNCSEIWWLRHQQDYTHGATGAALNNSYIDVGQARYLVFRVRTESNAKNCEFYISTTGKNGNGYSVAADGTETKPTTSGMVTVTSSMQAATAGEWTTFVIDLAAIIPEFYVKDAKTGTYVLDTFAITYSKDNDLDFEFMAFVEGGWEEIDALTPDETVVFVTDRKNKTYEIVDPAVGYTLPEVEGGSESETETEVEEETETETDAKEEVETEGGSTAEHNYEYTFEVKDDGTTLHTAKCNCCDAEYTKTVDKSVVKFFSGYDVALGATTYALKDGAVKQIGISDDGVFFGRVRNHAEIWWMRDQADFTGGTGDQLNNKSFDVGQAKYFVFRLRTNDSTKNFEFYISTTGKNGDGYAVAEDGSETRPTTNGFICITSPVQASTAGEWTTYVMDLEMLIPEYYVKDAESGSYIIDTFAITYSKNVDMDVEFMAFVEGGWAEIDALTPDETVIYVTHYKNKTYSEVKASDGECVNCSYSYSSTPEDDGSVTYKLSCSACGALAGSHNVPASVNMYYQLDAFKKYNSTDKGILAEDGVIYHAYSFTSAGHIFVNGKNAYSEISGDSGSLLVIKYRASGDASISLEIATADNNKDSGGTAGSVDGEKSYSRAAANVATEWCVAVVDLSMFSYTKDADENVQVRLTTKSSTIDIAYVAIVDDLAEAESLIDDDTYTYFADWTKAGEVKAIAE